MTKDIKDYLPLYLGQKCYIPKYDRVEKLIQVSSESSLGGWFRFSSPDFDGWAECKLLLHPLSSMTEEDFRQIAIKFFNAKTFASQGKFWYACSRLKDPDYEGTDMEFINDCGDDDPVNVLMCDQRSKHITYGWILYEENYHSFSVEEEADIIKLLLEMAFDVYRLIPEGLAIDLTTVKL